MRKAGELLPIEEAAILVERLAVLITGGCTPTSAWEHLAQLHGAGMTTPGTRFRRGHRREQLETHVQVAIRRGADPATALRNATDAGWRAIGAVHRIADLSGAPLGASLRELAGGFADLGASEREVRVALAGPVATSRIVLALPIVGLALGAALGFDTLGVLTGSALGAACLAAGGLGILAGWWWNRALVAKALSRPATPGLALDLVALGLGGGRNADAVLATVHAVLRDWRLDATGLARAGPVLDLSQRSGVPAAGLLRSEAKLQRQQARTDAAQQAARLGVQLMLPLGVCLLPAFLALGVAPLVIAVLRTTFAGG